MFSDFPDEKEILIEPERKLSITRISIDGNIIAVNTNILGTPLILKDVVEGEKAVKIKEKKSRHKEVPEKFITKNTTKNTMEPSWSPVNMVILYKISSRKTSSGLFSRNQMNMLKRKEIKCIVRDLEKAEYEFRLRCVFDDGMEKWSGMIKVMPLSWKRCPKYVDK